MLNAVVDNGFDDKLMSSFLGLTTAHGLRKFCYRWEGDSVLGILSGQIWEGIMSWGILSGGIPSAGIQSGGIMSWIH